MARQVDIEHNATLCRRRQMVANLTLACWLFCGVCPCRFFMSALLILSAAKKMAIDKSGRLLSSKRLALVLDLDNTLLHCSDHPDAGRCQPGNRGGYGGSLFRGHFSCVDIGSQQKHARRGRWSECAHRDITQARCLLNAWCSTLSVRIRVCELGRIMVSGAIDGIHALRLPSQPKYYIKLR